jgi:hypothetical protein
MNLSNSKYPKKPYQIIDSTKKIKAYFKVLLALFYGRNDR